MPLAEERNWSLETIPEKGKSYGDCKIKYRIGCEE